LGTRYRALASLGGGPTSIAYAVQRVADGSELVAKVLRHGLADDPGLVRRMRREARTLSELVHPNIVRIVDFAELGDGRPFIVLERLNGRTLEEEVHRRELSVREAVLWTSQLLSALGAVHRLKIVHRDISLRNLFLHRSGQDAVVKVLDFGFSKFLRRTASGCLTEEGLLVGSPHFTAPEAVREEDVDERYDVYAAGLVLLTLLTGTLPFSDLPDTREIYLAHVWKPLPRPSELRRDVPPELDAVVMKALAKLPEHRFASAQQFLRALGRVKAAGFSVPATLLE
jgi:serine/threonine-protein kinase